MKPEQIEEARNRFEAMVTDASAIVICAMDAKGEVKVHVGSSAIEMVFIAKSLDLITNQMLTQRTVAKRHDEIR